MDAYIAGFLLGFSLILAIGAQNAFVLRQGLRRAHVLLVCLTCAVSDAILITLGVGGFGQLSEVAPWFATVMRYGGAAFLLVYGALAFRSAWRGGAVMEATSEGAGRWQAALATCLALTWLNPHVYLDTVVLLGSIAAQYDGARTEFGAGAVTSSFVFFFSLGYGARALAPVFANPQAWRILDIFVGLLMWAIAVSLLV
ncbi:LysE/ArgO family amino acid transporter [Litoreibacter roseus]|uniref:Amino acid transporter n=1 Tax=Litoreibacter roseus TaxID=2601869 RepID=A0A6N6JK51_9RHOB|nr:LysE/ArgO family amino acid transporter [Litoreibacter roseus]GFE65668.1 amino acid transporter [Litoreibacter roseus]